MKNQKFQILSPDGFTIEMDKEHYSDSEVKKALKSFVERYKKQGYYSSNNGRIPLNKIVDHCSIIPVD